MKQDLFLFVLLFIVQYIGTIKQKKNTLFKINHFPFIQLLLLTQHLSALLSQQAYIEINICLCSACKTSAILGNSLYWNR